jgi:hypothetical protein
VSTTAPVNGRITPTITFATKVADDGGTGAGNGLATEHWALTGAGLSSGEVMYAQWEVDDPAATGGEALSTVATFRLFCGSMGCALCPVDFNTDGVIGVQDIFAFISAWFAGDPRTDFNGSGTVEVQDLFAYLSAWFVGC